MKDLCKGGILMISNETQSSGRRTEGRQVDEGQRREGGVSGGKVLMGSKDSMSWVLGGGSGKE